MTNEERPVLHEKLVTFLDTLIHSGKVKINGIYVDQTFFKTVITGNSIRKYIYLSAEKGLIEEAQLFSDSGDLLAVKPFKITKGEDGLVIAFEFGLTLQMGISVEKQTIEAG